MQKVFNFKPMICILSITIFIVLISVNMASAIVYTGTQDQTVSGQDFTFIFDPVLLSDGTDGSFTIEARGDYFEDAETLGFNIEDIFYQLVVYESEVSYKYSDGDDDRWWTRTWTVPGTDLLAITSDAYGAIEVNLALGVGAYVTSYDKFVSVELEYTPTAVPIPGTLLLFGSGLFCLSGVKRRMKQIGIRELYP